MKIIDHKLHFKMSVWRKIVFTMDVKYKMSCRIIALLSKENKEKDVILSCSNEMLSELNRVLKSNMSKKTYYNALSVGQIREIMNTVELIGGLI